MVKVEGRSQMAPLPAIVSDKQACKYCPQKRNCAVYNRYCFFLSLFVHHLSLQLQTEFCNSTELQLQCITLYRAVERDPMENCSEDPQPFVQSEREHLSHVHLQYFSHWLLLCTLEALTMENKAGRRNIWLQTAQQRWVFYKIRLLLYFVLLCV